MEIFKLFSGAKPARGACAVFVLFVLGVETAWACYVPPKEQLIDVNQQIALARDVTVAKVVRASQTANGEVEYELIVQKRIAGPSRASFTIIGHPHPEDDARRDFNSHTDERFWQRGGGRLANFSDCVIHPTFIVGASYLVFLGQPVTRRSFERIETIDDQINAGDKWLSYVVDRAIRFK